MGDSLNTYSVGGGKTVVSTVVALMRGNRYKLVIVPPVLITPWVKWLKQVTDNVLLYRGTPKERDKLDISAAQWVVMSHAIYRQEYAKITRAFGDNSVELIVDEAHAIKNTASVLFKKVNMLCQGL